MGRGGRKAEAAPACPAFVSGCLSPLPAPVAVTNSPFCADLIPYRAPPRSVRSPCDPFFP